MNYGQTVWVACTIKAGAFLGERVVQLPMAEGSTDQYSGIAPVRYCLDGQKNPLGRNQPTRDTEIDGFIVAILMTTVVIARRSNFRMGRRSESRRRGSRSRK